MSEKMKLIIDCDPGHDDAIAILMAMASPKIDLTAVTVVGGNQTLEKCINNALRIKEHFGFDFPVAAGASGPMMRELKVAPYAHGESGMDGPVIAPPKTAISDMSAVELMAKVISENDGKTTIAALGPLTNIAILILAHPDLIEKIDKISIMGGAIFTGNRTPTSEFNIWEDPEAADIVFKSGIEIAMHGLDITYKAGILEAEWNKLRDTNTKSGIFIADILDFFSEYHKKFDRKLVPLHDPVAIAYLTNPEIFSCIKKDVVIDCDGELTLGVTVVDTRVYAPDDGAVTIGMEIDREKFIDIINETVSIIK